MLLTFHAFGSDLESLIQKLELDSMLTIVLSESNYIKPNNECYLLFCGVKRCEQISVGVRYVK